MISKIIAIYGRTLALKDLVVWETAVPVTETSLCAPELSVNDQRAK